MLAPHSSKRPIYGGDLKDAVNYINGNYSYTGRTRSVVEQYEKFKIIAMMVHRKVIGSQKLVDKLNLLKNKPYDELFHLFLVVTLENGIMLRIEKNATINIFILSNSVSDDKIQIYKINKNLTLGNMLKNTENHMGTNKYYQYSAINNNCQMFLDNILKSNRMGRREVFQFINQDLSGIVSETGSKLLDASTYFGAVYNSLVE